MFKILLVANVALMGFIVYLIVILIRVMKDDKRIKKEMTCRK